MLRLLAPIAALGLIASPALAQNTMSGDMSSNTTMSKTTTTHTAKKPMHKAVKKTTTTTKTQ